MAYLVYLAALIFPKIQTVSNWATAQMSKGFSAGKKEATVGSDAKKVVDSAKEEDKSDHGVNTWFAFSQLALLCFALYHYLSMIPSAADASCSNASVLCRCFL